MSCACAWTPQLAVHLPFLTWKCRSVLTSCDLTTVLRRTRPPTSVLFILGLKRMQVTDARICIHPHVIALFDHQGCEDKERMCAETFLTSHQAIGSALWQMELRREALHIAEEFREHNRTALLNLLSDSTTAVTGFLLLLRNSEGRGALFRTIGRIFSGFSDTAKAFLIIASAQPPSRPPFSCPYFLLPMS